MARIAAAVLVLGLAACDGAKPPADPAVAAPGASGAMAAGGPSAGPEGQQAAVQPGSVQQGPAQPLDTATWILPPPFYAAGDEPFWRLEISDGWFAFRRSGLKAIEEPLVQPARVSGADVFTTGALKVSIKREACEMDQGSRSEYAATVTFDSIDYDGCVFGGQVAASQEAGTVTDALTSIDACLAKLGQPAVVTAIYPRQDGEQKAVALRARTGQLYECATDSAGATVAYLDPIERGAEESWMSRMRFLRSTVTTTATCPTAEEVRADDKVVGKLLAKGCKF
ncbi:MAG: hypothetical protein QM773_12505 [Hyphomonadaceae bacterium]